MRFWRNFLKFIENQTDKLIHTMENIYRVFEVKQSFEANINPIKSVCNAPIELLPQNDERVNLSIQNIGTEPCYICLGEGIGLDNFHFILAADTEKSQGNGGSIELKNWHGSVYAICKKETQVSILEY